tara:strand:+ start:451 stop:984 length:534 start_codon:yes stop_codon:yes gene_type:complete
MMKTLLIALLLQAAPLQTPADRLDERLEALSSATAEEAVPLVDEITALWADSGSDTISLLMDRGEAAAMEGDLVLAARMFDHVTEIEPDFSEGWLRAAQIAAGREDWAYALEALNETLTVEPRRFDAYLLLGRTLERAERPESALEAYDEALAIYPQFELARRAAARIRAALAGRPL